MVTEILSYTCVCGVEPITDLKHDLVIGGHLYEVSQTPARVAGSHQFFPRQTDPSSWCKLGARLGENNTVK